MSDPVLERQVFHAGKTIVTEGETHANAYIIQEGEVLGFVMQHGDKVEIGRFGPGAIIGETNLLIEAPSEISFEALTDVTVVTVVRQDFEKKLTKIDSTLNHIIKVLLEKLKKQEKSNMEQALDEKSIDAKAFEIVEHLLRDMAGSRKRRYQQILQPHFNVMCRALEDLKKEERTAKQKEALEKRTSELKEQAEPESEQKDSDSHDGAITRDGD